MVVYKTRNHSTPLHATKVPPRVTPKPVPPTFHNLHFNTATNDINENVLILALEGLWTMMAQQHLLEQKTHTRTWCLLNSKIVLAKTATLMVKTWSYGKLNLVLKEILKNMSWPVVERFLNDILSTLFQNARSDVQALVYRIVELVVWAFHAHSELENR